MKNILKKQVGSIALISMLVIAAFCLILVIAMADSGISSGYQYVNRSNSLYSYNYAEGCFEEAIHRIEGDINFSGYTMSFTGGTCAISVSGTNPKTVNVILNYSNYSQSFRGTVDVVQAGHAINATLSTWSEI